MASVAKRKWTHRGKPREAWVVRYVDENGKHRSKQFDKKKDADDHRQRVERETRDGVHLPDAEGRSVRDVAEAYIRAEELRLDDGRISRGHYVNVKAAMTYSVIPLLGGKLMHRLTAMDVEQFYAAVVKDQGLMPISAKERVIKLGQLCEHAIKLGCLKVNPVPAARKSLKGVRGKPIRTITADELKVLLTAANVKQPNKHARTHRLTRCFVHLAAFCGLRFGEITGLTLANVDFDRNVIQVRHSLSQWDDLKAPKTASGIRDVPLPSHVRTLLLDWIDCDFVPNDRNLIFRAKLARGAFDPGGQIRPGTFHLSYWRPLLKLAGLYDPDDNLHFHALRHFFASWMISNGMGLIDAAQLLGHRTFDTTLQVYAHAIVAAPARAEMLEQMAARALPAPPI